MIEVRCVLQQSSRDLDIVCVFKVLQVEVGYECFG
jgi:hypothetical protein